MTDNLVEVVKLRKKLNWFEKRPLFGQRVVVTRTREQASDLARQIVIRPSVICATLTTAIVVSIAKAFHFPAVGSSLIYALAAFVILSSYLFEPELRGFLVHGET